MELNYSLVEGQVARLISLRDRAKVAATEAYASLPEWQEVVATAAVAMDKAKALFGAVVDTVTAIKAVAINVVEQACRR